MNNAFQCPHCKKDIELTEALKHQFDEEFQKDLEMVKKETEEKVRLKIAEEQEVSLKDAENEKKELKEQNKKLQESLLELNKSMRDLKTKDEERELEMEKKLSLEGEKIKLEATKKAEEEQRLKILELEKQKQDALKEVDEMKRKLQQGSQQSQGEVLELDFENSLRNAFPTDEIVPVGKGVRGADLKHIVKTPRGTVCGVILWETKRTKAWDTEWTNKLKNELRIEKANVPIIVTHTFPKEIDGSMGIVDGVWIIDYSLAIPVAEIMRQKLIDVAREKYLVQNRSKGNEEQVYDYILSHEFGQEIEAAFEVQKTLVEQVNREKAAFEKQWKIRLELAEKLAKSTARVIGTLQVKVGSNAALQIKGADLLEEGNE